MKPSFFSKPSKGPSELDTLRDTTKLLSLRMGRLESEVNDLQKEQEMKPEPVVSITNLQIRQLEDDFIASQTRIQAFHESIASAMSEMNAQLQQLEFRLSVYEKRQALLEKHFETKQSSSFRTAKQVFEKQTTKETMQTTS